ncbi:MAG: hypothetical protein LC753_17445 [Acidobacteria bacterium]|nr:hypothetical protein [Acidobacteriota bacterium]MCA1651970.1 hypothetical protein [Acidobacteriota bacterium]
MGKRELLLIVAFVIAGVVVYQATAPPPTPGQQKFSFSRILDGIKREVRGHRARAEVTSTTSYPAESGVTEVRIAGGFGELIVTGEARKDLEAAFRVSSNGFDEAEARKLATESQLKVETAGSMINVRANYPEAGTQRGYLTLKVPAGLRVRVEPGTTRLTITDVAGAELIGARGETTIKRIAGRVAATQRGGRIAIEDAGSLKLTGRGSDAVVTRVTGESTFELQAGELTGRELRGQITVDGRSAEVTLQDMKETAGPVRMNVEGGRVSLTGLKADARIDARNTEVEVSMTDAAPLAIYNEGDERIELTPPAGGYQLDAVATDGRLTLPDGLLQVTDSGTERRAAGAVKGGGPTITLRSTHGSITVTARP